MPDKEVSNEQDARQQSSTYQPQATTLPSGGGMRGIDEKFMTQPATGTFSYQIPVYVSPGRMGWQPEIALSYQSGSGNGPFGLGWSVSLPAIRRKTDQRLPRYDDWNESDVFQLSDAEDLVPMRVLRDGRWELEIIVKHPYEITRYRPRSEQAFARIERWWNRSEGKMWWQTISRDHVISIYGRSESCRIADPQDPTKVYSWLLEERSDDRGNITIYEYKAEDAASASGSQPQANRYIKRIRYGNKKPFDRGEWLFEIVFDYGDHDPGRPTSAEQRAWLVRPDAYSSYRAGFEMRTARLCRRILMFHRFAELGSGETLVRSTNLEYEEDGVASLLRAVWQTGYMVDESGEARSESTPPITLTYTRPFISDEVRECAADNQHLSLLHLASPEYEWVDLDQTGTQGILNRREGAWYYIRNLGEGMFAEPELLASVPAEALGKAQNRLMDLAGEGRLQLVNWSSPTAGYYERSADGWESYTPFPRQLSFLDSSETASNMVIRRLDLNGDGIEDLLRTDGRIIVWHPSLGKEGYEDPITVKLPDEREHQPILLLREQQQTLYIADMNGDGLSDIVRIRNGEVCYWPNLGYGNFGNQVVMRQTPWFDHEDLFDPRRLRLADLDGSGTADLVYISFSKVTFWLNESGNSWGAAKVLASYPDADNLSEIQTVDLLANGTQCLVWSSPLARDAGRTIRYIDLMGHKPYLLTTITNNLGGTKTIKYKPSTYYYIQDERQGRKWRAKLPFPVQVVSQIIYEDEVQETRLVSEYDYHHGYYDGKEREFRGFGFVEQWDTETAAAMDGSAASLVKSWFHTGDLKVDKPLISLRHADEYHSATTWLGDSELGEMIRYADRSEAFRSLKGKLLRQEIYGLDDHEQSSEPYQISEYAYVVECLQPAVDDGYGVFYCRERENITVHTERQSDDPRIIHHINLKVDEYGHVLESVELAYPRRSPAYPEQAVMLGIYKTHRVLNLDSDGTDYRLGVRVEESSFEMCGLTPIASGIWTKDDVLRYLELAEEEIVDIEEEPEANSAALRLIGSKRMLYWDDDGTSRLDWGKCGMKALLLTEQQLVLTPGLVEAAYGTRVNERDLETAGYTRIEGRYWTTTGEVVYAPDLFYQVIESSDPLGHITKMEYDEYALFPISTTDPLGNRNTIQHDYRTLQPWLVTDVNRNRNAVRFDALGRVIATAVMGKQGAGEGDDLDQPTVRFTYEYHRWMTLRQPVRVLKEARLTHGAEDTEWQITYTYEDGSGRVIAEKMKTTAGLAPARDKEGKLLKDASGNIIFADTSPAPRWLTSGHTVYDHKGQPVKQYEPYFSATAEVESDRELQQWGVSSLLTYDPLGRLIRTDMPNGAYTVEEISAWQIRKLDANDTVLSSEWYKVKSELEDDHPERRAAELASKHADTPYVEHQDVLGRTFLIIEDNGERGERSTRLALDMLGHQRSVTDARGITLIHQIFDLTGGKLLIASADAGEVRTLLNAVGDPMMAWNGRGEMTTTVYDACGRPTHIYLDRDGSGKVLVERLVYGEQHAEAEKYNLRGMLYRHYDSAGVVTNECYDFSGNLIRTSRRLGVKYDGSQDWSVLHGVDSIGRMEAEAESHLEEERFVSETAYNALQIPIWIHSHDGSKMMPTYNPLNQLIAMEVLLPEADEPMRFVDSITYDAKGQRQTIRYGNGLARESVPTAYDREASPVSLSEDDRHEVYRSSHRLGRFAVPAGYDRIDQ